MVFWSIFINFYYWENGSSFIQQTFCDGESCMPLVKGTFFFRKLHNLFLASHPETEDAQVQAAVHHDGLLRQLLQVPVALLHLDLVTDEVHFTTAATPKLAGIGGDGMYRPGYEGSQQDIPSGKLT